jgi:hypothetical protein
MNDLAYTLGVVGFVFVGKGESSGGVKKHRLVETESNFAAAVWATKQVADEPLVVLSWCLVAADRAGGNIPEVAVGAYCREKGADNISAVLASRSKWLSDCFRIDAIGVPILI